jgi:hypothetical protein
MGKVGSAGPAPGPKSLQVRPHHLRNAEADGARFVRDLAAFTEKLPKP